MKVGSLFAGIGGFDLAAEWMGWETKWYAEVEPYARAVLRKRFPRAIGYGDIRRIKGNEVESVDILCGGFPCQDISVAGSGAGIGGARSGLWKEYARLIDEIRPAYVVAENVSALRSRGLDTVLRDIQAVGYDAEWHCIPASYLGAPHRRDRIWIIAYPVSAGRRGPILTRRDWPLRKQKDVAYATSGGVRLPLDGGSGEAEGISGSSGGGAWKSDGTGALAERRRNDGRDGHWWDAEPPVGRMADGLPADVDRIRCLGNALVPQVAFEIFRSVERDMQ